MILGSVAEGYELVWEVIVPKSPAFYSCGLRSLPEIIFYWLGTALYMETSVLIACRCRSLHMVRIYCSLAVSGELWKQIYFNNPNFLLV